MPDREDAAKVDHRQPLVNLTASAWNEVRNALDADQGSRGATFKEAYLRVGVKGGGCGGFSYDVDLVIGQPDPRWHVWEQHDPHYVKGDFDANPPVRLAVDPISAEYLRGTTIDFIREGLISGFRFNNPNATRQCGCGKSFST
jgi:iron-sulfur cluster assembly protein